ncbi:leucine-rich repeat domain-containing protein [Acaryochloris sp. 'Moss Beach']|uniref:leucine-rich repeat domain-containing protein n=1 Tax=Acaryochloris sp. 'Moss Beach' TaxID=2740837 RepID=UPI001F4313EB|nr:leucine-rich repeat domain-containing protein [Acaryochloris sp. 'Moss Beach']UJB70400.1 leucine-rich repeat domain-containing protein [Acaryochloris sp. 'Moss Beach']
MAQDKPYQEAERKIAEALRTGATTLNLECSWLANDSEKLTELPESMGQLSQLQKLYLDSNQLTTLPESMGQLSQLQKLYLDSNQLTTLPVSLKHLEQLLGLDLRGNAEVSIPSEIAEQWEDSAQEILNYYFSTQGDRGSALR